MQERVEEQWEVEWMVLYSKALRSQRLEQIL